MSFFINNEFKSKYELHTPKQLISDAGIKLLQFELDDVTGGFTVTIIDVLPLLLILTGIKII